MSHDRHLGIMYTTTGAREVSVSVCMTFFDGVLLALENCSTLYFEPSGAVDRGKRHCLRGLSTCKVFADGGLIKGCRGRLCRLGPRPAICDTKQTNSSADKVFWRMFRLSDTSHHPAAG